jgi:hypothetical protein
VQVEAVSAQYLGPFFQHLDQQHGSWIMDDRRKNYRAWDADQNRLEPVSPQDVLPEEDLVFFLLDLVPQLDLTPFHKYYAHELRGQPPFDVTMMVRRPACEKLPTNPPGLSHLAQ